MRGRSGSHAICILLFLLPLTPLAVGATSTLAPTQVKAIKESFQLSVSKLKGPYTENFCVCADGAKEPVSVDGKVRPSPCGKRKVQFCAAFRAPWNLALAEQGLYLGNIFSRDLFEWDAIEDHHALARGYLLEKYFTDTHPKHKLAELRAFGGLSGVEYEAVSGPALRERYLAMPDYRDVPDFLIAYEMERRFYVRGDQASIDTARKLATQIQTVYPKFKPLRDAIHNQVSIAQAEQVRAFRDALKQGSPAAPFEELATAIEKLTALTEGDLKPLVAELSDASAKDKAGKLLAAAASDTPAGVAALSSLMAEARAQVASRKLTPTDARRLIALDVAAASVLQLKVGRILDKGPALRLADALDMLVALVDAAYGTGLLTDRERTSLQGELRATRSRPSQDRTALYASLTQAGRISEWAQNGVRYAFEPSLEAWTTVLPDVALVGDDVIRASPLLAYAEVARRLGRHVAAGLGLAHDVFGRRDATDLRALNPGLGLGRLLVQPAEGGYSRDDIVALAETPSELQPVAGILTLGEGNIVSHMQLLARNLGVPNVTVSPALFRVLKEHAGSRVLFLATPLGRVIVKEEAKMTPAERAMVEDYTANKKKASEDLGKRPGRLHIDVARLDVKGRDPVDLRALRRADSGARTGPKAAYLGELAHMFPERVSRGVVLPFGAYYEHYQRAQVAIPAELNAGKAQAVPLRAFVEATYATYFDRMLAKGAPETELSAYIKPRLDLIQKAITGTPISPDLERKLRDALGRQGLLDASGRMTVGCFVRSDTNVEDLPSFTGAGLNLTVFNLKSLPDVLDAVKQVWASPFSFRSFAWRQSVIDQPLWVLPSIVVLESVPSEKSGVLITSDMYDGAADGLVIATSEGVGGAVDGSPAETLLWTPGAVRLMSQFKSPWRRLLKPEGGFAIVPSTASPRLLGDEEINTLADAARTIGKTLAPVKDPQGKPRPWDIEFGFAGGKLWLFQVRPFVGNDEVQNLPALRALDQTVAGPPVRLDEVMTR